MRVSALAGKPATQDILVDIPKLVTAYYSNKPDPSVQAQRVAFGTSGHRGSSFKNSFNEDHILATTQAICLYRSLNKIDGPLFIGMDTHALSQSAYITAIEVLAANGVTIMLANNDEYTPTPAISHAILTYNKDRKDGLADGIVITPSHNPPDDGGFKYNPTNGGPAGGDVTGWIEKKANELLDNSLNGVKRIILSKALALFTTKRHDYLNNYIHDLDKVINIDIIRRSGIRMGVDPLGGAGVHYWPAIAEYYKLENLTVTSQIVDPTFSFMTVDWDGQIRMDPSSPYAMARLIAMKDKFDISFACDTDHDRHGIVTKSVGLMPPNHYLAVAISYLLQNREHWKSNAAIGKTVVSSKMIDKVTHGLNRELKEVPVGFKWFADGLVDGSLCFGGEESAGASFTRLDGSVWTTDKDGLIPALLSAEITARVGHDPGEIYKHMTDQYGDPAYDRVDAPATSAQKAVLAKLSASQITATDIAGEKIEEIITNAPGNNAAIGGVRVSTKNGWFAARPSGTEDIYKIYAESFKGKEHLQALIAEAQSTVDKALAGTAAQK